MARSLDSRFCSPTMGSLCSIRLESLRTFDSRMNFYSQITQMAHEVHHAFTQQNTKLDKIIKELQNMATSLENLTAQVSKNSDDIDAALAALKNSGASPEQLDALTKAIADKDTLIETALNMPAPKPPVTLP